MDSVRGDHFRHRRGNRAAHQGVDFQLDKSKGLLNGEVFRERFPALSDNPSGLCLNHADLLRGI
ncbi:MAG TPA: hypothetical protein VLT13_11835 [Bacteroidota bacterium]|nr:hypothetical protein [Bacteroidota bacterium]